MQVLEYGFNLPSSFRNMNYGIVVHRDFNILQADDGYAQYLGFTNTSEVYKLPSLLALIHPDEHDRVRKNYKKLMSGELKPSVQIFQNLNAQNEEVTVMTLEQIIDYSGAKALQVTVIDISEHVQNQRRLLETEARYKELVEGALQAILVHERFKPIFCNQSYATLIGMKDIDSVMALDTILDFIPEENQQNALTEYDQLISGTLEHAKYEARGYKFDGDTIWVDVFGKKIHWNGKSVVQVSFMDITEQHLLREQIRFRATYDGLTEVLNRASISEQATNLIKLCKANIKPLACLLIDIDDFKQVNDKYGHCCGDQVLTTFARFCQSSLRGSDLLGRWGGEEFLIILPETSADNALKLADRIREDIANLDIPINGDAQPINISISMGLSMVDGSISSLQKLVSIADECLYEAKAQGKNQVVYKPL